MSNLQTPDDMTALRNLDPETNATLETTETQQQQQTIPSTEQDKSPASRSSRPIIVPRRRLVKKKRSSVCEDDDAVPSPEEIKNVQYLEKAEALVEEMNKMNNSMDFEVLYSFHVKHCHEHDALHSTVISLFHPSLATEPCEILVYREIKGFPAMASFSAASLLTMPDGSFTIRNIDLRIYTAQSTPYKNAQSLQPLKRTQQLNNLWRCRVFCDKSRSFRHCPEESWPAPHADQE